VAEAINKMFGKEVATPRNATAVAVQMPEGGASERVNFVAQIENLDVTPDAPARVVYNERTGTIVMGSNVRIATCIITHGNLILKTEKREAAALAVTPGLVGQTTTAVGVTEQRVKATEEPSRFRVMQESVTVGDIAHGLNALGVSARDIISILQALKQCGALQADLVAM
jgi:flagellar P-ring protein precursor FlgI